MKSVSENGLLDIKIEKNEFELLQSPIKSDFDKNEYRIIRLKNGLKVCLISKKDVSEENETDMASGCLCVNVGSFSDPPEVDGMAHFVEHMAFMGSRKYPEENDFMTFIRNSGGMCNAKTESEATIFIFRCIGTNLREALDKWAQLFISPLMKKESIAREREAVESEFQMNLPNDTSRKHLFFASLAKSTSPVNRCGYGNLQTLKNNITDDQLYEKVHQFRERHYSAHRMTLAVESKLPLDTLQSYVLESFSNVPSNNLAPLSFEEYKDNAFTKKVFNKIYYLAPVTDMCTMSLTWLLEPLSDKYKTKPAKYITYILQNKGEGSLFSYLKKKQWIITQTTTFQWSETEPNSLFSTINITFKLTEVGFARKNDIIKATYSYINMIKNKGPKREIFEELQNMKNSTFKFSEFDLLTRFGEFSRSLQQFPPEHVIDGSKLLFEYNPQDIIDVLSRLRPDNMIIIIMKKDLPSGMFYDNVEKWFGAPYTSQEIPTNLLKDCESVTPYPEMDLPKPNPYIATKFTILSKNENGQKYPQKILSTSLVELWFKQDDYNKMPKACYSFQFFSPNIDGTTIESFCCLDLMCKLLGTELLEEKYLADQANINFSAYQAATYLEMRIEGYDEKIPLYVDSVSKKLKNLQNTMKPDIFNNIKNDYLKVWRNSIVDPSVLATNLRLATLSKDRWTIVEVYEALQSITFDNIKTFITKFLENMHLKVLVLGNTTEAIALGTVNNFVDTLGYKAADHIVGSNGRTVKLPLGEKCIRIQNFNKNDTNTIVHNFYQGEEFTYKDLATVELITSILRDPLFTTLRTKEQLGYSVSIFGSKLNNVLGVIISVNTQATKNTAQHVDSRIEEFIKNSHNFLTALSSDIFEKFKNNAIKKRKVKATLERDCKLYWSSISENHFVFDILEKQIKAVEDLTIDDLKSWWEKHTGFGSREKYSKLSVQVIGHLVTEENDIAPPESNLNRMELKFLGTDEERIAENKPEGYFIKNLTEFKNELPYFDFVDLSKLSN